ncbi:site-specific recombinase [Methanosarcina siciliae C2J]|uniref:Site-specific recombinase n=1 Tax=Methanosarcina siciliae C2J TaxID=1434118 RepID=A0A0E3PJH0_9EURY|nr:site-specific recombinase [Methanosarcina siciliae C2J]
MVHIRDEKEYTLSTCSNYFAALSTFYDFLEFERIVDRNIIPSFRKRYMRSYKKNHVPESRQLISVEDMGRLIDTPDILAYRVLILFLAKTGIRRNELIMLDRENLDLDNLTVYLKPTAKRSNRTVFFDLETKAFLEVYLDERTDKEKALFVGVQNGHRITRNQVYDVVAWEAFKIDLHDPKGRLDQKFGPHCCRHWYTTWLRRAGMSRPFIQELRGDARKEAIDVYDHIEKDELKEAYLQYIPKLGVKP